MKTTLTLVFSLLLVSGVEAATMKVDTETFATAVASSNDFEIESSKLAKDKSESADVKSFADEMISDHMKAGEAFKQAMKSGDNTSAKPALSPKHAAMLELLKAASGKDFDALYIDMQAGAHMEAVSLFSTYAETGDDPEVTSFAKKTLPTLEMHKDHVMKLVQAH